MFESKFIEFLKNTQLELEISVTEGLCRLSDSVIFGQQGTAIWNIPGTLAKQRTKDGNPTGRRAQGQEA